jgi:signal transduction histidine kinase
MSSEGYGIADQLLKGDVFTIDDLALYPRLSEAEQSLFDEGICSIVIVPLTFRGAVVGALNLGSVEPVAFSPEQIEIAREVADQLGIAIHQAHLHEQIQRHATELEARVAERTAELTVAYQELQALNFVKDEFVSNVSHELRTPIASLKLFAHLLTARPEKQASYIASLKREADRLSDLIEGLLMLSRLDQDHITTDLAPFDLNSLVQEYVADRTLLAESRRLDLVLELASDLPDLKGDRNLLGQVLSILLTNAFNYTPEGGQVTVLTLRGQDSQEFGFCVADTGPGILPEERLRLFDRFYRGSAARASKTPGTGLGLAIAKEIVNRHQGRIEVRSDGVPSHGSSFSVWLSANSFSEPE